MSNSGYVIANENEEFLTGFHTLPGVQFLGWSPLPSNALLYPSRSKALRVLRKIEGGCGRLWLLNFLETPTMFILACPDGIKPPWF